MAPLRALLLAAVLLGAPAIAQSPPALAQAPSSPELEYRVKAVFLLRFAQFVEWPRQAFVSPNAPLVIGVVGEDPFGGYLDGIVQGETIDGRPIVVRHVDRLDRGGDWHILFVAREHTERVLSEARSLTNKPVLLVGDADRFAHEGGMIAFVVENKRVRFRINPDAARAAGLSLSSKLLRAAEIVPAGRA